MIRVLLVDDHPMFRAGAASAMAEEPDFEVIGEAQDANEALELIQTSQPDVVLLDIRLKGRVSGIALARQVRSEYPQVKIMVLTNFANEPYIRAMMEVGVEGYLTKDTPAREVVESIRMLKSGRTVFSEPVAKSMVRTYVRASSGNDVDSLGAVTRREAEVLQLLSEGASNPEIAEDLHVSVSNIQYHLTNIYSKLGVRSRAEAIVRAARVGLIVIDDELGGPMSDGFEEPAYNGARKLAPGRTTFGE
jgi:DNA-binding NarL/FixJ family response regulator